MELIIKIIKVFIIIITCPPVLVYTFLKLLVYWLYKDDIEISELT